MGWLKKQFKEVKASVKDELKFRSEVKKAEKESYREARKVEAHNYGVEKAKYERQQRVKALKQRPKSFDFKGFAGPTQKNAGFNLGLGDALVGSNSRKKKKRNGGLGDMGLF